MMRWSQSLLAVILFLQACASAVPNVTHKKFQFPKDAYMGEPDRPYEKLGVVKSRSDYLTINANDDEVALCKNYFNDSVKKLVELAKDQGADAVIQVRSVVHLLNGKIENYPRAECAEENGESQNLAMGIAIKWKSVSGK
ncbi:MAG: hypothetical protein KA715_06605 [Xanthomonadaceae bacterium]|nr:hypothetical protein [Xanthomonadaceae bacterium]